MHNPENSLPNIMTTFFPPFPPDFLDIFELITIFENAHRPFKQYQKDRDLYRVYGG